jgi:hypothetical protein
MESNVYSEYLRMIDDGMKKGCTEIRYPEYFEER